MKPPKNISRRYPSRRGLAVFEFVLLFPLMIALIMLAIYVGNVSVQQLEYANGLHFETWRQRYDNQPGKIEPLVFTNAKQGEIKAEKSDVIKAGSVYDSWKHEKKTSSKVYANAWSAKSKWNGEGNWSSGSSLGLPSLPSVADESNNQRVFYNQKRGKTYARNNPYYAPTFANTLRNDDYVSPVGN